MQDVKKNHNIDLQICVNTCRIINTEQYVTSEYVCFTMADKQSQNMMDSNMLFEYTKSKFAVK